MNVNADRRIWQLEQASASTQTSAREITNLLRNFSEEIHDLLLQALGPQGPNLSDEWV